jgi:hypothetical protein
MSVILQSIDDLWKSPEKMVQGIAGETRKPGSLSYCMGRAKGYKFDAAELQRANLSVFSTQS